jgi:hypothetical protein
MRPVDLQFTYDTVAYSNNGGSVQTGTINPGTGFKYLYVQIDYTATSAAGAAAGVQQDIDNIVSQFTFEQQNSGRRLDVRSGNLYQTISSLNRSTDSKTMQELVYDPAVVSGTTGKASFYIPISTNANTGGITITMGLNWNGIFGAYAAGDAASATVRFGLAGVADGTQPTVIGVPTGATASPSRVTIPSGTIARTMIHDSVAENLTILRLPGQTFTDATMLNAEWHLVNGSGNRNAGTEGAAAPGTGYQANVPNITDENKFYAYNLPYVAGSGSTLEFERAAISDSTVYFVVV